MTERLTMQEVIKHCDETTGFMERVFTCMHNGGEFGQIETKGYLEHKQTAEWLRELQKYKDLEEQGRLIVIPETGIGDFSDGYHTFNELYHHRAVLFSVICNSFKSLAWKSKKHNDGTMYNGMFIVGIVTPQGDATYHYDIEPYWNMFDVKELDKAPEWDGHTPSEAIERISKLAESDEGGAE